MEHSYSMLAILMLAILSILTCQAVLSAVLPHISDIECIDLTHVRVIDHSDLSHVSVIEHPDLPFQRY